VVETQCHLKILRKEEFTPPLNKKRRYRRKNFRRLKIYSTSVAKETKSRRAAYYMLNRKEINAKKSAHYAANIEKCRAQNRTRARRTNAKIKFEVLSHYSPNGKLKCFCRGCKIQDIDMLSLDHINNDGAKLRRSGGLTGIAGYRIVRRDGYPEGYQTLCYNHQAKKEILRCRSEQIV
jgi:hypothetical protein